MSKAMPTDNAIIEKGSEVLLRELRLSGFFQYVSLLSQGNNDYLKIQDEIFGDMTVEDITKAAEKHWHNQNSK